MAFGGPKSPPPPPPPPEPPRTPGPRETPGLTEARLRAARRRGFQSAFGSGLLVDSEEAKTTKDLLGD